MKRMNRVTYLVFGMLTTVVLAGPKSEGHANLGQSIYVNLTWGSSTNVLIQHLEAGAVAKEVVSRGFVTPQSSVEKTTTTYFGKSITCVDEFNGTRVDNGGCAFTMNSEGSVISSRPVIIDWLGGTPLGEDEKVNVAVESIDQRPNEKQATVSRDQGTQLCLFLKNAREKATGVEIVSDRPFQGRQVRCQPRAGFLGQWDLSFRVSKNGQVSLP